MAVQVKLFMMMIIVILLYLSYFISFSTNTAWLPGSGAMARFNMFVQSRTLLSGVVTVCARNLANSEHCDSSCVVTICERKMVEDNVHCDSSWHFLLYKV